MCRFRALSTPTIMNTISTPENSQANERFCSASPISRNIRVIMPTKLSCSGGPFGCGRWGICFCVPQAEARIEITMSRPSVMANGAYADTRNCPRGMSLLS